MIALRVCRIARQRSKLQDGVQFLGEVLNRFDNVLGVCRICMRPREGRGPGSIPGEDTVVVFNTEAFSKEVSHARARFRRPAIFFERMSKRRKGFPSEAKVKRGMRFVHEHKLLEEKLGRNDLCPCGSGKRFKKCCLKKGSFRWS